MILSLALRLSALAILAIGLAIPAPPAAAQARDALSAGVPVGAALPHDLKVPDQTDQVQSFVTLKKNRGLILIFSRSLSW